jgi:hypothetical protein
MVFDHTPEHPSQWAAIRSVGEKLGIRTESLRRWVRQAEHLFDRAQSHADVKPVVGLTFIDSRHRWLSLILGVLTSFPPVGDRPAVS